MKIAIFNEFYPPDHLGGAERTAQVIYESLSGRSRNVCVLTGYVEKPSCENDIFRIIPRYNDPSRTIRKLTFIEKTRLDITSYFKAREFYKNNDITILLVRSVRGISLRPIFAAIDLGIPVIFMVPDDWLAKLKISCDRSFVWGAFRKAVLYKNFDYEHILCPSEYLLNIYLKAGFKKEKLSLFPHAVDTEIFKPGGQKKNLSGTGIIFVGRLFSNKGLHVLVEASKLLKESGKTFQITVAGKGDEEYESSVKRKVKDYGLEESFAFKGMVPQDDLPDYYRSSDIAVVPSLQEAFGITLIEAMSCGLPVVASRTQAIPEIINDGVDGVLVEPGDPGSLAKGLARLIEDKGKRASLGASAREKAINEFSLDKYIEKLEKILGLG
ncbi:MAG: glycosyltransferase family 4 protein [Candidatus Omnitrophota bacterium]